MVGIYQYACGLHFTGIVADTKEEAQVYLYAKFIKEHRDCDYDYKYFVKYSLPEVYVIKEIKKI